MHRVDAFCCCRCCTFPCLSVFDKKTGESCKNRSTAEKLEGTSRGVDADPVLFPPPSLPRCCSTHVADAQPRVTKHWKQCTCTSIVQLLHPHIHMLKIHDYTIFQLHDIIFCYCQLLLYLWRIKVHIHQQSHMCDTVLIWKPLPTEILTSQWLCNGEYYHITSHQSDRQQAGTLSTLPVTRCKRTVCYWSSPICQQTATHICKDYTHTRLTALFPGLPGWAGTRKVKPIWILLKQETVSGSGISWAICKSASRSRQITMPVPHHSSFFTGWMPFLPPNQQRQSTEGKHWVLCVNCV